MRTIFFSNAYSAEMRQIVYELAPKGLRLLLSESGTQEETLERIGEADYFFAGRNAKVDEELLQRGGKLKMVQRFGAGLNSIDLNAMKCHQLPLYVNRGINASGVAELTVLFMLALSRRLLPLDAQMRRGIWNENSFERHSLSAYTVGLIGYGEIGKRVREMLHPFGPKVVYWKRSRLQPEEETALMVEYLPLEELLACSNIVSLHCMLDDGNRFMINSQRLEEMKDGAYLINTARGKLVEERALIKALQTGKLGGAALDVFDHEPIELGNPLLTMPNVILTPHAGGVTKESFSQILRAAFYNIEQFDLDNLHSIEHCRII